MMRVKKVNLILNIHFIINKKIQINNNYYIYVYNQQYYISIRILYEILFFCE